MSRNIENLLNQLHFQNRNKVKEDTNILINTFTTLAVKIGTLIQNNGNSLPVLDIEGTIPIVFSGTQYNIPIQIYLSEAYPQVPPQIYVRPTAFMVIKQGHRNVDSEGLVYLPYLFNWNPTTSNLRELVTLLCGVFGQEPPLFAVQTPIPPPVARPISNPPSYNNNNNNNISNINNNNINNNQINKVNNPIPVTISNSTGTYYPPNPNVRPVSNPVPPTPPPPSYSAVLSNSANNTQIKPTINQPTTQVSDYYKEQQLIREKERLINEVTSRLQEEILMTQTRVKGEIESELQIQFELGLSREKIEKDKRDMILLKERFQSSIDVVKAKDRALDEWMKRKESDRQNDLSSSNIESKWVPYDDLSVQLVKLQSEYLAIDDTLYYLDRALASHSNPSVDLNSFLRETRKLARQQFLCKSHIRKIQNQVSLSYR